MPKIAAGIAHVLVHLLGDHAERARSMHVGHPESKSWRAAADSSVGDILEEMGLPGATDLRQAPGRVFPRERATEERYAMLHRLTVTPDQRPHESSDDQDEGSGCASCGSSADGLLRAHERAAASAALDPQAADEIRKAVAIAY